MLFLDKWERKFGWLSFPGLLRYYALFHLLVYLLQYLNPALGMVLDFDLEKILQGEVWRTVTFLFSSSGFGGLGGMSPLWMYFMVMIAFLVSDGLEAAWGVFRTSMFLYVGIAGLLIGNVIFSVLFYSAFDTMISLPATGALLNLSAFFAFATLFPKVELLVFFVLPVQVRWLAILAAAPIAYMVFLLPVSAAYLVLAFGNYLLWVGIPALRGKARGTAHMAKTAARKRKFDKSKLDDSAAFHRCKSCRRTDLSDPELEFRMAADGEEYCGDHLPE